MSRDHVCIIDGDNMLRRALGVVETRGGSPSDAGALFLRMLRGLLLRMESGRVPPTRAVTLFDPPRAGTWRRAAFPGYKPHEDRGAELADVKEGLGEILTGVGMTCGSCLTHEADDMIAALASRALATGMVVSVVSPDKDLLQLVRPGLLVFNPSSETWLNAAAVEAKMGVPPHLVADLLALAGDRSDGIPGAPGIGPKIAAALLNGFGDLEQVLLRAEEIPRPAARRAVIENVDMIRLSRRLTGLDADGCPLPFGPETLRLPDVRALGEVLDSGDMPSP